MLKDGKGRRPSLSPEMSRCRRSPLAHKEQLWVFSSPTGGTGVGPGGRDKAPPLSCWLCRMRKGEKSPRPGRFEASLGFFFLSTRRTVEESDSF